MKTLSTLRVLTSPPQKVKVLKQLNFEAFARN